MKFDILHRTRYTYAAPARDSFNDVRLEPPSIPEQKVESFLLRVLPAVRLRHYVDFYGNWIHHFEIPEPHNSLLIESQFKVETNWSKAIADDAELCPLEKLGDSLDAERCFDFLRSSRFIEMEADAWRLALDATEGQTDAWQATLAQRRLPGLRAFFDRPVPQRENSRALRQRLPRDGNRQRDARVDGSVHPRRRLARPRPDAQLPDQRNLCEDRPRT
jgi:hypothetical protein